LMILMNLTMILMIILTVRDKKKWVENSDTASLAVTRDYPDSHDIFKDTDIRIPLSVVNTVS
jgi:hypothetical protein